MVQATMVPTWKLEDLFAVTPTDGGFLVKARTQPEEGFSEMPLTQRELQVLQHLAKGNSNKIVGSLLGIGEQTVKNHLTSILTKLQANDRTHAVVIALHQRWIRF